MSDKRGATLSVGGWEEASTRFRRLEVPKLLRLADLAAASAAWALGRTAPDLPAVAAGLGLEPDRRRLTDVAEDTFVDGDLATRSLNLDGIGFVLDFLRGRRSSLTSAGLLEAEMVIGNPSESSRGADGVSRFWGESCEMVKSVAAEVDGWLSTTVPGGNSVCDSVGGAESEDSIRMALSASQNHRHLRAREEKVPVLRHSTLHRHCLGAGNGPCRGG